MHAPPDPGPPKHVGLSIDVVSGPAGPLARVWTAKCDSPTDFSSIASVNPGIGFVRAGGATAVHLRGPQTKATTLSCPRDAEYFGADFRLGAYLPMFPPARLANLQDAVLPILPDGQNFWGGQARFQDDKHVAYAAKLLESADALVPGRATYEVFAESWPGRTGELADRINSLPKYVASRTLTGATWNSQILPG